MGDLTEKIAEIIPAAYYDLISRIVSGGAILYLWALLKLPGVQLAEAVPLSGAYALVVAIAMSYVAGVLLTPVGYFLAMGNSTILDKWRQLPVVSTESLWKQIDDLQRHQQPEAAATLSKMAAEATLADNLVAGTAGLFVLSLLRARSCHNLLILSSLILLCFLGALFRKAVLVGRAKGLDYFNPEIPPKPQPPAQAPAESD